MKACDLSERFRGWLNRERGASAVWFIGTASIAFALSAVVIDVGIVQETHRYMQTGADSGALAGAAFLPENTGTATTTAEEYLQYNRVGDSLGDDTYIGFEETYVPNDTITVSVRRPVVPAFFAHFFGLGDNTTGATASAIIGSVGSAECVVPIGLVDIDGSGENGSFGYEFDVSYDIKLGSQASITPGNFQGLNIYGNGGAGFRDGIAGEDCDDVTTYKGQEVPPEPGNMVGPARQGFRDRVGGDTCGDNFYTLLAEVGMDGFTLDDSPCLAYIPIVDEYDNGASQDVTIMGLAMIFLEKWTSAPGGQAILTGRFVRTQAIGGWVPLDEYGTRTVRLLR